MITVCVHHKKFGPTGNSRMFTESKDGFANSDDFEVAGVVFVEDSTNVLGMAEEVYYRSQNIDEPWNPSKRSRSTSVGDILEFPDGCLEVSGIGFKPIRFI